MVNEVKRYLNILSKGCAQVLPVGGLEKKLLKNKKLKIKLGADPTAPDLHLGHAIVLRKMRQFQDLGHEVIFIIGDFTAKIGDPTGKSKTRPPLSSEQIAENAKTYLSQVGKILDLNKMQVVFNSQWLSKLTFEDFLKIAAKFTLARLIERDDFQKRLGENVSIGMHELFYPMMQGYDSLHLEADVELGGTDQTFNLLVGRYLQEQYEKEAQVIMTMPILEGLDGKLKMSKSYGNYVGLSEDPVNAFGKLMSITDELMWRYYSLLLEFADEKILEMQKMIIDGIAHPMNLKKDMAFQIVSSFWSEEEALVAREKFVALVQNKDLSQAQEITLDKSLANPIWIVDFLRALDAVSSSSEAKRLIEGGAVKINDEKVDNFKAEISWSSGMTVKVGKHKFYKIK